MVLTKISLSKRTFTSNLMNTLKCVQSFQNNLLFCCCSLFCFLLLILVNIVQSQIIEVCLMSQTIKTCKLSCVHNWENVSSKISISDTMLQVENRQWIFSPYCYVKNAIFRNLKYGKEHFHIISHLIKTSTSFLLLRYFFRSLLLFF
jgi:hypothetical protein